jgi:hypothetical protein
MGLAMTCTRSLQQDAAAGMIGADGEDRPELLVGPTVDRLGVRGRQASECLKKRLERMIVCHGEVDRFQLLEIALNRGEPQGKKAR